MDEAARVCCSDSPARLAVSEPMGLTVAALQHIEMPGVNSRGGMAAQWIEVVEAWVWIGGNEILPIWTARCWKIWITWMHARYSQNCTLAADKAG
jgi:hypothetical protein